jgi:adenylate cyclase
MAEQRVQRRLAAIMAADVVGYSRLMEADEEGTRARLRSLQAELIDPKIAADGGRIVKTMGDGILAEFPSAVDAVRNALAVQAAVRRQNADVSEADRITFRIGINVGDVIVEGDDIHGDGVNVAARLEGLCEPGEVYVSGTVHDQIGSRLAAAFDDLGEKTVKNMARPVRVYRVRAEPGEAVVTDGAAIAPALPDKPSIAVLPFDNMSGDAEQEYFSDGITEDIITELSRFRTLFVIARNSSFALRKQNIDVSEVGRKLGVKYVLEGSVRKAGNRVRITAQLIDASTKHHLWAERYDRELEDIFAVQDEITQAIVSSLPGRLEDAGREHAERKQTENLTAYDCVLLGLERLKGMTREMFAAARSMFQKAVELDPKYARAHALLAWTHVRDLFEETSDGSSFDNALKSAETALSLDDDDSWFHAIQGLIHFWSGEDESAEVEFRRAIALNANDADAAAKMASFLVYTGRVEEGLAWITTAKRLNPYCPALYHWYHVLALYSARDYGHAVQVVKAIRPLHRWGQAYLAMCYAQMNRMDEAHAEMAKFIDMSQSEMRQAGKAARPATMALASDRATRYRIPSEREHFLDGLRKAGLPE